MSLKEEPIIQVKHLSKQYKIGADTTYKTLSGSITDSLRSPLKTLKNFNKQNEIFWALKDINFEVNRGEVVGIIGRNGAGKSTLLKVLSRITHPTEGEIRLRGRVGSLLEVGTGFHPELTGRENIYFNGAILGMKKREIDEKFDEIVRFAEIDKFLDTPVKRYSSGMYVRLAFAVAAHMDPEILIVDEVLAVGDAAFQKKCLGKMKDVSEGGRTVLFVSHNMAAIQNLCNKVILLNYGKIIMEDKTENVIESYLMESSRLSEISLAERRDRQGTGEIRFTSVILQNEKGTIVNSFHSGQYAILVFCFENKINRNLKNFHIAVGIDNQLGQRITVLSNEVTNDIFTDLQSYVTRIEIHIERLPLTQGRYEFTIYSTVNGVIADWIQNAGFFDVEAGDFYRTGRIPPTGQGNFLIDYNIKSLQNIQ